MSALCFVDTNILVYSRDASEPQKQPRAREWMAHLWADRRGRISVQILSEYYVTVTRKLRPGLSRQDAWADVKALLAWQPVPMDAALIEEGYRQQEAFGLAWWDALVLTAAQRARCRYLLSEDFQEGQDFAGLVVVNPFRRAPADDLSV